MGLRAVAVQGRAIRREAAWHSSGQDSGRTLPLRLAKLFDVIRILTETRLVSGLPRMGGDAVGADG